jgi:hypothetical protein
MNMATAQLLSVSPGTDLVILGGTTFRVEDFTLIPTSDYVISNNTLIRSATIDNSSGNPYISRVYQFTNATNPFTGSVQINFEDGAELNGIAEGALTLNVHDGTSWIAYPVSVRDGINNFVLTNGLSNVLLNELTLADLAQPLPLIWLSFTATKQDHTALLKWATAQERNTRDFAVQHSSNGINWTGIGKLPAAGNSDLTSNYRYVHLTPLAGNNYYRILQTDKDNRSSYSDIRILGFSATDAPFNIIGNPVTGKVLTVQVNKLSLMALYSADGKLMWQQQVKAGTKHIDVSRFAKGTYLLKANFSVQKVLIQ